MLCFETYMTSKIYLPLFVIFPPPPLFYFHSIILSVCCTLHSHFLTQFYLPSPPAPFFQPISLSFSLTRTHTHTLASFSLTSLTHIHPSISPHHYICRFLCLFHNTLFLTQNSLCLAFYLSSLPLYLWLSISLCLAYIAHSLTPFLTQLCSLFFSLSLSLSVLFVYNKLFFHTHNYL